MSKLISYHAPPQDPIYGVNCNNIADRLNPNNWRDKAIFRIKENRSLYVYVIKGSISENGIRHKRYLVRIHFGSQKDEAFKRDFQTLKEALAYANGEDSSEFAHQTRLAKAGEFPRSQEVTPPIRFCSR